MKNKKYETKIIFIRTWHTLTFDVERLSRFIRRGFSLLFREHANNSLWILWLCRHSSASSFFAFFNSIKHSSSGFSFHIISLVSIIFRSPLWAGWSTALRNYCFFWNYCPDNVVSHNTFWTKTKIFRSLDCVLDTSPWQRDDLICKCRHGWHHVTFFFNEELKCRTNWWSAKFISAWNDKTKFKL